MKRILQLICLFSFPILTYAHVHNAKADYLGLISELAYIKQSSENLTHNILNNPNSSPLVKSEVTEQYNSVKTVSDQLILQLIADSKRKNSLCYFHDLDKMLVCKNMRQLKKEYYNERTYYRSAKIEAYVYNLLQLHKLHKKLLNHEGDMSYYTGDTRSASSDDNTTFFSASIKNMHASRAEKVEKLSVMLDAMRLCPVQYLVKPVEKKMEPEKAITRVMEPRHKKAKKHCKCK